MSGEYLYLEFSRLVEHWLHIVLDAGLIKEPNCLV